MTDNRTLREQVAEAIWQSWPSQVGWPNKAAADAAIQAVLERLRCGQCEYLKQYSTIVGRNRSIYFCELQQFDATVHGHDAPDNFGCISWKEK